MHRTRGSSLTLSLTLSHQGRGSFWRKIAGARFIAPSTGKGTARRLSHNLTGTRPSGDKEPQYAHCMGWCGREQPPRHRNDCRSGKEWSRHFSFETASRGLPLHGFVHRYRGQVANLTPTFIDHGACRGAKPRRCGTKSQIRNPKRVQGFLPAEGLGVPPNSLLSSPKSGGQRGLTFPLLQQARYEL